MKTILFSLICLICISGCKNKELSVKDLTQISVIRNSENLKSKPTNTPPTLPQENTPPIQTVLPTRKSLDKYYVIVASFSTNEKTKAEKMVERLKAENYPASLLSSSERYRVSIESFPTEKEANIARDKYRTIRNRQDIWVFKAN